MTSNFSKRDTSIIKGFAIICIVFHNYFHWLYPSPGENEFDFSASRIATFFKMLGNQSGDWFNILFSYLGHYGVQIFVLVSGFGLTISMINRPRTWESFELSRLKKLYPLLLTGVLTFVLGVILMESQWISDYTLREIGYKLIFIHTLLSESGLSVNGPWWFFGLIFQLYLLFPLLYRWFKKWGWKAFLAVCLISYGLIFLFRYGLDLYKGSIVMMNAPGHLPEFCLGIMLALQRDKKIGWGWLVLAVAVFCLGNVYEWFYPFTFLALSLMAVFGYQGLKRVPIKKRWLSGPLAYFGGISMTLFAVHGFFRAPVLKFAQTMNGPWGRFCSGLIFLLIVWAVAIAAKVFYDFLCRQLDKIHIRESRATHIIGRVCQVALGAFFAYVLAFFIAQNLNRNPQSKEEVQVKELGVVADSIAFTPLIEYPNIDRNWLSFDLQGSFDFSTQDTLAPLPLVVLEIPGKLWVKFEIPASYNSTVPQRFEFSHHYYRPLNHCIKGKKIKLYLWNPKKAGPLKLENTQVTILR